MTCEDITQKYEAGVELARLGSIAASSDDAIISNGLDGRITSWNAGATRIFGYQPKEIIGQPMPMLRRPVEPTNYLGTVVMNVFSKAELTRLSHERNSRHSPRPN